MSSESESFTSDNIEEIHSDDDDDEYEENSEKTQEKTLTESNASKTEYDILMSAFEPKNPSLSRISQTRKITLGKSNKEKSKNERENEDVEDSEDADDVSQASTTTSLLEVSMKEYYKIRQENSFTNTEEDLLSKINGESVGSIRMVEIEKIHGTIGIVTEEEKEKNEIFGVKFLDSKESTESWIQSHPRRSSKEILSLNQFIDESDKISEGEYIQSVESDEENE